MRIKFKSNRNIKRVAYNTKDEFKFDKKTNVVPKKTNCLICIMFGEDKTATFLKRKVNLNPNRNFDYFRFKKGMYIIDNESIHISSNNIRVAFYLEGISTPIKMSNIEKEIVEKEYFDLQGNKQKSMIQKIKGLKFDAKILDIFANRRFAEIFTRTPMKSFELYLLIIGIISLVMIGIGYGVSYAF
jgi:hypothetical protein